MGGQNRLINEIKELRRELRRVLRALRDPDQSEENGNRQRDPHIVIKVEGHGTQLAWQNHSVKQTVRREQIAPGFEAIAAAVVNALDQLPALSLSEQDHQEAEAVAHQVLDEVTQSTPDRGWIRRGLTALKGFFWPVAKGLSTGAGEGAQELAKTVIQELDKAF